MLNSKKVERFTGAKAVDFSNIIEKNNNEWSFTYNQANTNKEEVKNKITNYESKKALFNNVFTKNSIIGYFLSEVGKYNGAFYAVLKQNGTDNGFFFNIKDNFELDAKTCKSFKIKKIEKDYTSGITDSINNLNL